MMFAMTYPQHAVSQWIGHSVAVSLKHYVQTPDSLFETVSSARVLRAAVCSGTGSHGAEFELGETASVSTPETKRPRKQSRNASFSGSLASASSPDRTEDLLIKSQLLYRLS